MNKLWSDSTEINYGADQGQRPKARSTTTTTTTTTTTDDDDNNDNNHDILLYILV